MDDKMYLTATAQGEVKVTGGRAEEKLGARLQRIGKEFGFFGVLSIFYGVSASFCLFRNPLGITVPLFVAVTYGAAFLIFRKMGGAHQEGFLFAGSRIPFDWAFRLFYG